ncbi:MAG: HAD family hydrolase [Oscillospiraceae bacterium]|jgi:D-glycero-D-manno-heptose 1,7-bisphosphate phosphatase|nr:HAD family hydrolase [Oscillospiraceae bacterium]
MNKCVFLDRDGTINIDKGYTYLPSDLEIISGVPEALKMIKSKGFLLIVIMNQSGIARGKYKINDIDVFHNEINRQLIAINSVPIDAFYVCPHYVLGTVLPYNTECNCRKPLPGMILQAVKDYNIDLSLSYMIGDKESDVLAGKNAGINKSYLVDSNHDILYYANIFFLVADETNPENALFHTRAKPII